MKFPTKAGDPARLETAIQAAINLNWHEPSGEGDEYTTVFFAAQNGKPGCLSHS